MPDMFILPDLPYAKDALEPHISRETLAVHHDKHHKAYVDKLNQLLATDSMTDFNLEEVILMFKGDKSKKAIFNNAAQCWNHEFLWESMTPNGGGPATDAIKKLIEVSFGDDNKFTEAFAEAAVAHFGSGWIWLVLNDDKLEIMTTHDADLPLVHDRVAIITCDLWEHAYYLDYQNRRPDYVKAFLENLVNWDFANANLAAAKNMEPV